MVVNMPTRTPACLSTQRTWRAVFLLFVVLSISYASADVNQNTSKRKMLQEPMRTSTFTRHLLQTDVLGRHNAYRARHQAPPLSWDPQAAAVAQAWTDRCVFEHSQGTGMGENLGLGYSNWDEVIDGWYNEVSQYNYGDGFSMATGHFTQVVWVGTKGLGCGVAQCPDGPLYVCNYTPPGNYLGEFAQNVLPPGRR